MTPHTYRKTVATVVEAERDIKAAAGVLGNHEEVTRRHYVQRAASAPDVRAELDGLDAKVRERLARDSVK